LPITYVTVWHDLAAILSTFAIRNRPRTVPEPNGYVPAHPDAPRTARQIAMRAIREEDHRLLG
jgi:hypothetical protein